MARNLVHGRPEGGVNVEVAVPATALIGDVVVIGGLTAWLKTDRATAETIAAGTSAPGLTAGQATVRFGGNFVVRLPITGEITVGELVQTDGDGGASAYSDDGDFIIGQALTAANGGPAEVYIFERAEPTGS